LYQEFLQNWQNASTFSYFRGQLLYTALKTQSMLQSSSTYGVTGMQDALTRQVRAFLLLFVSLPAIWKVVNPESLSWKWWTLRAFWKVAHLSSYNSSSVRQITSGSFVMQRFAWILVQIRILRRLNTMVSLCCQSEQKNQNTIEATFRFWPVEMDCIAWTASLFGFQPPICCTLQVFLVSCSRK